MSIWTTWQIDKAESQVATLKPSLVGNISNFDFLEFPILRFLVRDDLQIPLTSSNESDQRRFSNFSHDLVQLQRTGDFCRLKRMLSLVWCIVLGSSYMSLCPSQHVCLSWVCLFVRCNFCQLLSILSGFDPLDSMSRRTSRNNLAQKITNSFLGYVKTKKPTKFPLQSKELIQDPPKPFIGLYLCDQNDNTMMTTNDHCIKLMISDQCTEWMQCSAD